jgi:hypothetical protein
VTIVAISAITVIGRDRCPLLGVFSDGPTGVPSSGPVAGPRSTANGDLEDIVGGASGERSVMPLGGSPGA